MHSSMVKYMSIWSSGYMACYQECITTTIKTQNTVRYATLPRCKGISCFVKTGCNVLSLYLNLFLQT